MKPGWGGSAADAAFLQILCPICLFFFFFNTLFCFYVDHCGPHMVFLYFIFVVVSSHCCALCHHIASFSCQQRGEESLCQYIVSVVKTKYSVAVFPLSSAGTWIHVDCLLFINWDLSTGSKGKYLRIKGFCISLWNVLFCMFFFSFLQWMHK